MNGKLLKLIFLVALVGLICALGQFLTYFQAAVGTFAFSVIAVYFLPVERRRLTVCTGLAGIIAGVILGHLIAKRTLLEVPDQQMVFNAFGNDRYELRRTIVRETLMTGHVYGLMLGMIAGSLIGLALPKNLAIFWEKLVGDENESTGRLTIRRKSKDT